MRLRVRDFVRSFTALSACATTLIAAAATQPRTASAQAPAASMVARANSAAPSAGAIPSAPHRNIIIFIADGLRHDSVNAVDAPTLFSLRKRGVHFINSHSLYPTLTTPNSSAIATGHYLGDTGDFSNTEYAGYPTFNRGDFGKSAGTPTAFLENDPALADLDGHVASGNFLNEESLLALARQHGFNTAAIGKLGPVAVQDVSQLNPADHHFPTPQTVILDDGTGAASGIPLAPEVRSALAAAGLGAKPTPRDQPSGTVSTPGTMAANTGQQKWFADAATKAVLPLFVRNGRPFVLVFWSRDPDGTQHNHGDSLNELQPGINGPSSKAAIANADANLKQLLDYVDADPTLQASTDLFVSSDHGFATISKHEVDARGHGSTGYSTRFTYMGADGKPDVHPGWLPPGFLAIDLSHLLGLALFDPDAQVAPAGAGSRSEGTTPRQYLPIDPTKPNSKTSHQHSATGNGLLGGTAVIKDPIDARVIVTAGGGTDLIYIPDHDRALARKVIDFLSRQDYTGALFVDSAFGSIPGALPMSAIALEGAAVMPRPSIVVSFKSFLLKQGDLLSAVQVSDTVLQEGQGMHGGFGREATFNNMVAVGPDFKHRFTDPLPVSNADIAPTLAHIMGLQLPSIGKLQGRVLEEALQGDAPATDPVRPRSLISPPTATGKATKLLYQELHGHRYFDSAALTDTRSAKAAR
jgi:arylsulfatase A-like enzyme